MRSFKWPQTWIDTVLLSLTPQNAYDAWSKVAILGDSNAIAPIAGAIALALVMMGAWRHAILWLALFCSAAALVAFSKIANQAWGWEIAAIQMRCISGHAMLAASVLPTALYVLLGRGSVLGLSGFALGQALGALVAVSRVQTYAHTISESAAGAILGGLTAAAFVAMTRQDGAARAAGAHQPSPHPAALLIVIAAPLWAMTSIDLKPDPHIAKAARILKSIAPDEAHLLQGLKRSLS